MQQATTGTAAYSEVTFRVGGPTGAITDPTTVQCQYWKNTTPATTVTYRPTGGPITRLEEGVYGISITTTGAGNAVWTVNWIGTGAVAVVTGKRFRTVARRAPA